MGRIAEVKSLAEDRSASAQRRWTRTHVGHREGDTVIGATHQQATMTLVERKIGYAIIVKIKNKTADLVSSAIITQLKPLAPLVKTMTFNNGKEFTAHQQMDKALQSTTYFADSLQFSSADRMRTSRNTSPKRGIYQLSPTRSLE